MKFKKLPGGIIAFRENENFDDFDEWEFHIDGENVGGIAKETKTEEQGHRVMAKGRLMVLVPIDKLGSFYRLTYPNGKEAKFLGYELNEIISKHNSRIARKDLNSNEKQSDDKSIKKTDNRSARPLKTPKKGNGVLDEGERKYLEAVLRPFKNEIEWVAKKERRVAKKEFIIVQLFREWFTLPCFEKGTMYEGMVRDCGYSPKELGLWTK